MGIHPSTSGPKISWFNVICWKFDKILLWCPHPHRFGVPYSRIQDPSLKRLCSLTAVFSWCATGRHDRLPFSRIHHRKLFLQTKNNCVFSLPCRVHGAGGLGIPGGYLGECGGLLHAAHGLRQEHDGWNELHVLPRPDLFHRFCGGPIHTVLSQHVHDEARHYERVEDHRGRLPDGPGQSPRSCEYIDHSRLLMKQVKHSEVILRVRILTT